MRQRPGLLRVSAYSKLGWIQRLINNVCTLSGCFQTTQPASDLRGRVTVTGSAIRTRAKLSRKPVDFTVQGRSDLTAWVCTEKASKGAGVGVCTVSTLAGDNSRSRRARNSSDMLRLRRSPCPYSHFCWCGRCCTSSFQACAETKEL